MRAEEGTGTFFKGLKPLWMRQIPYTMMKFACFEKTVEAIYEYVVPKPRAQCSGGEQLMVTFAAGYIAGVFCAIVSHPADSVVSLINKDPSKSAGQSKSIKTVLEINFDSSPQGARTQGCLERSWHSNHHDRYPHRPPVVHLRWCQGRPSTPPTTTTSHARISQEEAWHPRVKQSDSKETKTTSNSCTCSKLYFKQNIELEANQQICHFLLINDICIH
jgi:hypothetical protein